MLFGGGGVGTKQPGVHFLRISSSQVGMTVPVLVGRGRLPTNMLWWGDYKATLNKGPGKGFAGAAGGTYYTYSASFALALCLGPIKGVGRSYSSGANGLARHPAKQVAQNWDIFTGVLGQSPWAYLTSHHPGQDLGYTGIAYLAVANWFLGTSPQLPQNTFEVFGLVPFSSTIPDANPADAIQLIITDATFGMEPGATWIGDLADFRNYCTANGFFISAVFDQQRPGRQWIALLLELLHVDGVWSEGQLRIVPYATQPASGNGVTWTPNLTPICSFNDDDYIGKPGEPPVTVKSTDPINRKNVIKVEYMDVSNDYNINNIEMMDESDAILLGVRRDTPRQYHPIPNAGMAMAIAQLKLQWALYVTRQYIFKAPPTKAALLDPMDVVSITDTLQGIQDLPVRVVSVEESGPQGQAGYELTVTCEDVGPDSTPGYLNTQVGGGGAPVDPNATPSDINTPIIFEPVFLYSDPYQIWLGLSGQDQNDNWGGCNVWMSTDGGNSYAHVGTCTNPATMGALLADLPAGSDPDIVNTLAVDLSESAATLDAISSAQADQGFNLCWIDGELIAFANVESLATEYQFNLTYLRRGLYGTPVKDHPVGAQFVYLGSVRYPDQGATAIVYPKNMVGQAIYLKFTSFNTQEGAEQDLADVDAWKYTVVGPTIRQIPPSNGWTARTVFAAGAFVNASGYAFEAIVGGTSGATSPTWPQEFAATVVDGGVLWQNIGPSIAVTQSAIGAAEFTANGLILDWFGAVLNPGGWIDVLNQESGTFNTLAQFIQSQEVFSGPLEIHVDWYSSGQLDFLVPSGSVAGGTLWSAAYPGMPLAAGTIAGGVNGYLFRFDPTDQADMGQVYRLDNGGHATKISTAKQPATHPGLSPAWHKAVIILNGDAAGNMQLYVDGVLRCIAVDATYQPNGPLGYAYGQGSAPTRLRNATVVAKTQTLDHLPDGSTRAIAKTQHYKVAAAYTYTIPGWANHMVAYIYGAGGGGIGAIGFGPYGGGAGASVIAYFDVTPGGSIAVTVGAGGINGGNGGPSSIVYNGVTYQAGGGGGATSSSGGAGGVPRQNEYVISASGGAGIQNAAGPGPGGAGALGGGVAADNGKVVLVPSA